MSIFEITMLLCFGAAWPFSIYKSYTSKTNSGKSIVFLWVVLIGYSAGIGHKVKFSFDSVIYLYIINFVMVMADIVLFYRNSNLQKEG